MKDEKPAIELWWWAEEPKVPHFLRDVPNLVFKHQQPPNIQPDSVQCGSKIAIPDQFSLTLDDIHDIGTVGHFARIEMLGDSPNRHVLVTAGHVIDNASKILIEDDTDGAQFPVQVIPEFRRTLGIPQFRMKQLPLWNPMINLATLNEICLLETANIPHDRLLCAFPSIDCGLLFPAEVAGCEDQKILQLDPKLA